MSFLNYFRAIFTEKTEQTNTEARDEVINEKSPESSVDPQIEEDNNLSSTGIITIYNGAFGQIDENVFFMHNSLQENFEPKEQQRVYFTASRKSKNDGWVAISVMPVGNSQLVEDEPELENKIETIICKIEQQSGKYFYLPGGLSFSADLCEDVFVPFSGDNVKATVDMNSNQVFSVEPVRRWSFATMIKSISFNKQCGFTQEDVYFDFSTWNASNNDTSKTPKVGDYVQCIAIETSRGTCPWRAISIIKIDLKDLSKSESAKFLSGEESIRRQQVTKTSHPDIEIEDLYDFGTISLNETCFHTIKIRNIGKLKHILKCYYLESIISKVVRINIIEKSEPFYRTEENYLIILPMQTFEFGLTIVAENLGKLSEILVFEFDNFSISREIIVVIRDPLESSFTKLNQPFNSRRISNNKMTHSSLENDLFIIPGERPIRSKSNMQIIKKLPRYEVPSYLRNSIVAGNDPITDSRFKILIDLLSTSNYIEKFRNLLYLEEISNEIDMEQYKMERVCLRPFGEFLALEVPGLAEGRPSLITGDKVILSTPSECENESPCEGYIHDILKDDVLLKFNESFHRTYNGKDYDAFFVFNRSPLRRCHHALKFVNKYILENCLFPKNIVAKRSQLVKVNYNKKRITKDKLSQINYFNKRLNERQQLSVKRILDGFARPIPYIIYGPPGTGKTITVVESILQLHKLLENCRILVCAPSNSAVDLITQKLHESGEIGIGDMVRLNAFGRSLQSIPENISCYCKSTNEVNTAINYRIILITCISCGIFLNLQLKNGHFTHCIVDEAGQATEPETIIPIVLVAPNNGQVILAGDPQQLGPVLQSNYSKEYGLEMSLLERLSLHTIYERNEAKFIGHGAYNPLVITKLIENYRSHENIVELPNEMFYYNELKASADAEKRYCLENFSLLPTPKFPIIFHGIRGEDLREGNSPSWFNVVEAVQVTKYLRCLLYDYSVPVNEIGIISPYRKQTEKIRTLIRRLGLDEVKVASVEEFQGQERRAIIISTVRSNESLIRWDVRHHLGFVSNRKRFNVAITRAQSLLIIIGNPHILLHDKNWLHMLQYCVKNGGYTGCELPNPLKKLKCISNNVEHGQGDAQLQPNRHPIVRSALRDSSPSSSSVENEYSESLSHSNSDKNINSNSTKINNTYISISNASNIETTNSKEYFASSSQSPDHSQITENIIPKNVNDCTDDTANDVADISLGSNGTMKSCVELILDNTKNTNDNQFISCGDTSGFHENSPTTTSGPNVLGDLELRSAKPKSFNESSPFSTSSGSTTNLDRGESQSLNSNISSNLTSITSSFSPKQNSSTPFSLNIKPNLINDEFSPILKEKKSNYPPSSYNISNSVLGASNEMNMGMNKLKELKTISSEDSQSNLERNLKLSNLEEFDETNSSIPQLSTTKDDVYLSTVETFNNNNNESQASSSTSIDWMEATSFKNSPNIIDKLNMSDSSSTISDYNCDIPGSPEFVERSKSLIAEFLSEMCTVIDKAESPFIENQ